MDIFLSSETVKSNIRSILKIAVGIRHDYKTPISYQLILSWERKTRCTFPVELGSFLCHVMDEMSPLILPKLNICHYHCDWYMSIEVVFANLIHSFPTAKQKALCVCSLHNHGEEDARADNCNNFMHSWAKDGYISRHATLHPKKIRNSVNWKIG